MQVPSVYRTVSSLSGRPRWGGFLFCAGGNVHAIYAPFNELVTHNRTLRTAPAGLPSDISYRFFAFVCFLAVVFFAATDRSPGTRTGRRARDMGVGSSSPLSAVNEANGVRVRVKERYHAYLPKHINRQAVLTEEKVKLVHDHWNFIADEVRRADVCALVCVVRFTLRDQGRTCRCRCEGSMRSWVCPYIRCWCSVLLQCTIWPRVLAGGLLRALFCLEASKRSPVLLSRAAIYRVSGGLIDCCSRDYFRWKTADDGACCWYIQ